MLYQRSPRVSIVAGFLILIPATAAVCFGQTTSGKPRIPDLPNHILVLDGSPVHDVGNVLLHASNWGAIGSQPGTGNTFSNAPSAEWPAGSGIEYLYLAGVWVGAIVGGVPAVSTSAYLAEFRPSSSPLDIVYDSAFGAAGGHRIPSASADDDADGSLNEDPLDGFDNDLDGEVDEDFAAISNQMLARRFRDDDPSSSIYPDHVPMHLAVREESFQFSHADYDDFVGFTFSITNDGAQTLEDAYIAVFADGDVGNRNIPNYWNDDASAFRDNLVVDHGAHGTQAYDFGYWYDINGDGGTAAGYCGIVVLDHPTGAGAPASVGVVTYADFYGAVSYANGGDPTNDFERYELMSSEVIEPNAVNPQDHRTLLVVGPFAEIAPGETVEFSFALVVTPRDDFTNVERAAQVYHGQWFDLDGNPATGIDGKEHQEHWYLPYEDPPVPIAITSFDASVIDASAVKVAWETWADEPIAGFELWRAVGGGELRSVTAGLLPGDTRGYVDDTVAPGTRYEYLLVAHNVSGETFVSQRAGVTVPSAALALGQNAPNPFAQSTTIGITLPERAEIDVAVYDVVGRRVATIAAGAWDAGKHDLSWNGTDDAGRPVGAGVYFYRLAAGNQTLTRKLLVVR
jgi:hypothetical protein